MKKFLYIALAALVFLSSGCKKDEIHPSDVYLVGVYITGEHIVDIEPYFAEDNELYCLIKDGINEINARYNKEIVSSDASEALAAYDKALTELKALQQDYNEAAASGKDFGASSFSLSCYCDILKGAEPMPFRRSECFNFAYESNTRIISKSVINITSGAGGEVTGKESVLISNGKSKLKITGWKLYNEDCSLSNSGIITDVVVSAGEDTFFDFSYKVKGGKDTGNFYIIVSFVDEDYTDGDAFDLMVRINHTTV